MENDAMWEAELSALQQRLEEFKVLKQRQDAKKNAIAAELEPIYKALNMLHAGASTAKLGTGKAEKALLEAGAKLNFARSLLGSGDIYHSFQSSGIIQNSDTIHITADIQGMIQKLRQNSEQIRTLGKQLKSASALRLTGLESNDLTVFREKIEQMVSEMNALAYVIDQYIQILSNAMAEYTKAVEQAKNRESSIT